jgi:V8-like Glu-specific endopeptidase
MRPVRGPASWIAFGICLFVAASASVATSASSAEHKAGAAEVANPASAAARMHGVVFSTLPNGHTRTCSGTVVHSRYKSLVWTAGSCLADPATHRFSTKVVFVPGYRNGEAPFKRWSAVSLFVKSDFIQNGNRKLDYGGIVVGKGKLNGHTRSLEGVVGSLSLEFNKSRNRTLSAFGYPVHDPYDGKREYRCTAKPDGTDNPGGAGPNASRLPCPAKSASPGAGWVDGDFLFSVTGYTRDNDRQHVFGPYFDHQAKSLYDTAAAQKP